MKWLLTHCKVFSLLLCCLSVFYSSNSFSVTCAPGEITTTPDIGFYRIAGVPGFDYPSASTGCSSAAAVDKFWGPGYTGSGSGTGPSACTVTKTSDGTTNTTSITYIAGSCPTGFVVDGSICRNTCTPEEPCPAAGTRKNAAVAVGGISGNQGIGASMCATSGGTDCAMTCSQGIASYNEVSGQSSVYCESFTFTGNACSSAPIATPVTAVPDTVKATPVNDPPKSREDCPGGSGFASVNNVGMCLPSGSQFTGPSTTTTSTGGSVSSTSTTTVGAGGSNTTTTTTTYKDGNGNVTYSGTTTGTDGINQAAGNGPGGEKLNLGDAPTFDQSLPTETNFNIKAQGNPVFSTEIFTSTASCPADITYSVMGKDLSISFASICAFADVIRGIVLMLSALVAMRAVVTQ